MPWKRRERVRKRQRMLRMVGAGARMAEGYRQVAERTPLARPLTEKELFLAGLGAVRPKVTLGMRQLAEVHDRVKRTAEARERVRSLKDQSVPQLFWLAFGKKMPRGTHVRVAFTPYAVVFFLSRKIATQVGVERDSGGTYVGSWGAGRMKGLVAVVVAKPAEEFGKTARVHEAEHAHTSRVARPTSFQTEFISYVRDGRTHELTDPEIRDYYVKRALRVWLPAEVRSNLESRVAELDAAREQRRAAGAPTHELRGITRSKATHRKELRKLTGRAEKAREEMRARLVKQWDESAARVADAATVMPKNRLANLLSLIPFHLIPKRLPYLVRQYRSKSKVLRDAPLKYT